MKKKQEEEETNSMVDRGISYYHLPKRWAMYFEIETETKMTKTSQRQGSLLSSKERSATKHKEADNNID